MDSAHLSCRATWMLRDRAPSWRSQPVNQEQDGGEQDSRDCDLGKLERDIATVANDLGADLDQLLSKRRQRPVLDLLGASPTSPFGTK